MKRGGDANDGFYRRPAGSKPFWEFIFLFAVKSSNFLT